MAIVLDDDDFVEEIDELDGEAVYDVSIKVFGVGGGGGNALEHMAKQAISDVVYVAVNTDVPALRTKDKNLMQRLQIGKKTTKGRGAGGHPEVAAEAAREDRDVIEKALKGTSLVFISAGMGGGTGTGAAPVIAEIAQEMGVLTVGVVTKPFDFEREQKMNQAMQGIAEMRKHVDALVIIPNQRLMKLGDRNLNVTQAFAMVDEVLSNVVRSISELLNKTAFMNIDFADLKSTLEKAGDAHIAIGHGKGDTKVNDAVQEIVNSPLLETSIANAGKVLVNIVMSSDTLLQDVEEVMSKITGAAHPDVKFIYGADYDTSLKDEINVTVIATCFESGGDMIAEVAIHKEPQSDNYSYNYNNEDSDGGDNGITTTSPHGLDALITHTLSDYDTDAFRDIEAIFKNR